MKEDPVLIADGHLDLAAGALAGRRDLTRPVRELREREGAVANPCHPPAPGSPALPGYPPWLAESPLMPRLGTATVALPEMRAGRVALAVATLFCRAQASRPQDPFGMPSQAQAYAMARAQLAYYQALEREGQVKILRGPADLDGCLQQWRAPAASTPVGLILAMEGADPIIDPDQVPEWWEAGVRAVSLTHAGPNVYAHGTGSRGGLFPAAYPLLEALQEAGMVLDLSHLADLSFWQALERWSGPVQASHANCRALVPDQRQLSDEMIRAVVERGGVIGVVFYEKMLNPRWQSGGRAVHTMSAVAEHVDHICNLAGDTAHVAIGSDLDGGFGRELAPTDLDTIADLARFPALLRARGYGEAEARAVAHGNLVRLFREVWRAA